MKKIVIVDYGMGNLRSIEKNLQRSGYTPLISSEPEIIKSADKLILPGVGHFANGMRNLHEKKLDDLLNRKVLEQKTPILGICLGMQLFGKSSAEGNSEGLGWLDAETVRFSVSDKQKYKIPHMGWNSINIKKNNKITENISPDQLFYFVHSYHIHCNDQDNILTTTNYDYEFTSSIIKDNIYGVQFHPEKSHNQGIQLLKNFIELT